MDADSGQGMLTIFAPSERPDVYVRFAPFDPHSLPAIELTTDDEDHAPHGAQTEAVVVSNE